MRVSRKMLLPALALVSSAAIGQTVSAYTWVGGEPDPNTVYESVQKQDNATIPAEGTFKEWGRRWYRQCLPLIVIENYRVGYIGSIDIVPQ